MGIAVNGKAPVRPVTTGVSHYLRRAHRALHVVVTEQLASAGISMKHFHFLKALLQEEGITQVELSLRVGVERATVTVVLDEMEREGLVRRARHKTDRRKMHVFLTPKGRRTREALVGAIASVQEIALQGVPPENYEMFKSTVEAIVTNCNAHRASELRRFAS